MKKKNQTKRYWSFQSELWIRSGLFLLTGAFLSPVCCLTPLEQKNSCMAGNVIEGLEQGRILVIDELDSSIHFKLTRAIVACLIMN